MSSILQTYKGYKVIKFEEIKNTITPIIGKMELLKASYQVAHYNFFDKDGFVAEFGVYNGDSINNMASYVLERNIYGFDSFQGLPEDWRPGYPAGYFSTDKNILKFDEKVVLYPGWFNDTIPKFLNDVNIPAKFISVDCDLYSSSKCVLSMLKERVVPGTVIFFDEFYNYPSYEKHEYKAFHEFVEEYNVDYKYLYINPEHEQVSIEIKGIK